MSFLYLAVQEEREIYSVAISDEVQNWFNDQLDELSTAFQQPHAQIISMEGLKLCHELQAVHYFVIADDSIDDLTILDVQNKLKQRYNQKLALKNGRKWMETGLRIIIEAVERVCECGNEECKGNCQPLKLKRMNKMGKFVVFFFAVIGLLAFARTSQD
ncbi:Hypothetical_protein [Hexamita inflata]|uniref:Hypothetical_protein n=1 Tax=Hexamita inflata TaxID=28002 RepID=A0AA86TV51_9EUKA|nr:Hypothetical protein HINF_LOCUS17431 [Hexamita inflata]